MSTSRQPHDHLQSRSSSLFIPDGADQDIDNDDDDELSEEDEQELTMRPPTMVAVGGGSPVRHHQQQLQLQQQRQHPHQHHHRRWGLAHRRRRSDAQSSSSIVSLPRLISQDDEAAADIQQRRSVRRLLHLPAVARVYQAFTSTYEYKQLFSDAARRTYLPIVEAAVFEPRYVTPVEKRGQQYVFPGWCYGCRLCMGCLRLQRPHLHQDRTAAQRLQTDKQLANTELTASVQLLLSGRQPSLSSHLDSATDENIIPLPEWVAKELEDYYTESGITRKTTPTDAATAPPRRGRRGGGPDGDDAVGGGGFYIGMRQDAGSRHTLGDGSEGADFRGDGESDGERQGEGEDDEELRPSDAESVGGIIKVTVSQRLEEPEEPDEDNWTDDGGDEGVTATVERQSRNFQSRSGQPLLQASEQSEDGESDDEAENYRHGGWTQAGNGPRRRRHRRAVYKEPVFFKPRFKKKLTIPKDPFSKNRDFKMVRQSVMTPVSTGKKLNYIDTTRKLKMKDLKQFKLKARTSQEPQPTKRVAFSKKVQIHRDERPVQKPSQEKRKDPRPAQEPLPAIEELPEEPPEVPQQPPPPQLLKSEPKTLVAGPPLAMDLPMSPETAVSTASKPTARRRPRLQPTAPTTAKKAQPPPPPDEPAAGPRPRDPLDYLARYCIVHAHRIPAYESAFKRAAVKQRYRYEPYRGIVAEAAAAAATVANRTEVESDAETVTATSVADSSEGGGGGGERAGSASRLSLEEIYRMQLRRRLQDGAGGAGGGGMEAMRQRLEVCLPPTAPASNASDCELAKRKFVLDSLTERLDKIWAEIDELNDTRTQILAGAARHQFWDSLSLPDDPTEFGGELPPPHHHKTSKRRLPRRQQRGRMEPDEAVRLKRLVGGLPDGAVVQLLSKKQLDELKSAPSMQRLSAMLERCQQRADHVTQRIADTKEEIRRLALFGNTLFIEQQMQNLPSEQFRREQSLLYQKLHPPVDLELNIDLIEEALQDINGHLISKKEMQYVYYILNLPARSRVNLRLFSVIAALSEKVVQLEPIIRKMVNKMNFDALDYKVERCKELFFLLDDMDDKAPTGSITIDSLVVELLAGNLKDEHVSSVIKKFNREKKGHIDFLDYLTYVPLFLEIHERIVANPLNSDPTW